MRNKSTILLTRYCACKKSWSVVGTNPGNFLDKTEIVNKHIGLQPFPSDSTFSQGCNPFFLHEKFYREIFMPDSVKEIHRIQSLPSCEQLQKIYLRTRNKTKIQSWQFTFVIFINIIFMKFMSVWTKNVLKKTPHPIQQRLLL